MRNALVLEIAEPWVWDVAADKKREHAREPRLGKRRGVAEPSEPVEHVTSAKTFRLLGSLALPVADRQSHLSNHFSPTVPRSETSMSPLFLGRVRFLRGPIHRAVP